MIFWRVMMTMMMMMIEFSGCRSVVCLYRQIRMQDTGDDSRRAVEGWSLTHIYDNQFYWCRYVVMSSNMF